MNPDHVVLMDLQVSGCQYAARLDGEWKSSSPTVVRKHGLPPHFNLDAIALHRNGTKVAARSRVPSLDLDVHGDEFDTRTMEASINEEIEYALRSEGFEGVVDQSSPNGGFHIRLKSNITKPALQDWFASNGLPFPEFYGPETKNRLALPAYRNGLVWSLQDPIAKATGLEAYVEIWTSLPEGSRLNLVLQQVSGEAQLPSGDPEASSRALGEELKTRVPPDDLVFPDPLIQARLRQTCGESVIPLGRRYRSQPAIVDAAIFKAGLGAVPRAVLISNLVAYLVQRGREEWPSTIAGQIAVLVDAAMGRLGANRARAKALKAAACDPTQQVLDAVLSTHKVGDHVPIAGEYIREITGLKHHRSHAKVKKKLESSGRLRRVSRGSNLKGRCDLYMVIAE